MQREEKKKVKEKGNCWGNKKIKGQNFPLFGEFCLDFVSFFFPLVSEMNCPLVASFLQANCVLTHVV